MLLVIGNIYRHIVLKLCILPATTEREKDKCFVQDVMLRMTMRTISAAIGGGSLIQKQRAFYQKMRQPTCERNRLTRRLSIVTEQCKPNQNEAVLRFLWPY